MKQAGDTKEVRIADLQPHPANYRKHPPDQLRRLQASLEKHGQYSTVVVQASTNRILAGHGVVEAAKQRGEETILACLVDVDDAGALQILVDDNELRRRADDDGEALAEIIATLDREHGERTLTFEADEEIEDLLRELTYPKAEVPEEFPEYDESIASDVKTATCPECGHEFPI